MQTAFSITEVSFNGDPVARGEVNLSVNFQIQNDGPSHVSGLVITTDFWITSRIAPAVFQRFGQGFELWHVDVSALGAPVKFELIIFCDDFGGDTSRGGRYLATA